MDSDVHTAKPVSVTRFKLDSPIETMLTRWWNVVL